MCDTSVGAVGGKMSTLSPWMFLVLGRLFESSGLLATGRLEVEFPS